MLPYKKCPGQPWLFIHIFDVQIKSMQHSYDHVSSLTDRSQEKAIHSYHFKMIFALCTVSMLLNNGILHMGELANHAEDTFTQE